jgi:hypothetical protein
VIVIVFCSVYGAPPTGDALSVKLQRVPGRSKAVPSAFVAEYAIDRCSPTGML